MPITVETTDTGEETAIKVVGEVDLYTSPDLRNAISKALAKGTGPLRIMLDEVTYMDSSGVATLVEALRSADRADIEFILASPSKAVMKVLQLSRLDSVFTIHGSSGTAV
jgi:anti-sigma B factor antagonist